MINYSIKYYLDKCYFDKIKKIKKNVYKKINLINQKEY